MPFRVNSSGGGKNLAIYYVNVDLDMLEKRSVRLQRAEQFVAWMLAQVPADTRSHMLETASARQRLIEHLEDSYINNPPGDYEITARYHSDHGGELERNAGLGPGPASCSQCRRFF